MVAQNNRQYRRSMEDSNPSHRRSRASEINLSRASLLEGSVSPLYLELHECLFISSTVDMSHFTGLTVLRLLWYSSVPSKDREKLIAVLRGIPSRLLRELYIEHDFNRQTVDYIFDGMYDLKELISTFHSRFDYFEYPTVYYKGLFPQEHLTTSDKSPSTPANSSVPAHESSLHLPLPEDVDISGLRCAFRRHAEILMRCKTREELKQLGPRGILEVKSDASTQPSGA